MNIPRRRLAALGAALVFPCRGRAAPGDRPGRLGVLEYGNAPDSPVTQGVLQSLARLGWVEGSTLRVERRFAGGQPERYADMLRELAAAPMQVLFAPGHDIARAAKTVLPAVPVVTFGSEDPVRSGLVQSFARPGGSVTGVSFMSPELAGKRLEILKELLPGLSRVGVLREPAHVDSYYDELGTAASTLGLRLQVATVDTAADLEPALAGLRQVQALFVVPSRLTTQLTRRITDQALAARLPTMSAYQSFAAAGGLVSYGGATGDLLGRVASQIDRVLNGARPAEMPFELPTRFVLTLNLKSARRLGLSVPQALLLRADEVIE